MKKRVVSLLLCLIMALSLIPTVAFAAEVNTPTTDADKTTNGAYANNGWSAGGTGSVTTEDGLTLSKTAKPVPGKDNTYEITLSVVTSQTTTTTTTPGNAATVLVIDTSGSMAWCTKNHRHTDDCYNPETMCTSTTNPDHWVSVFHKVDTSCRLMYGNDGIGWYLAKCGTTQHTHDYATGGYWCDNSELKEDTDSRIANAKAAAKAFLDSYKDTSSTPAARWVAIVSFADNATSSNWFNVSTSEGDNAARSAIDNLHANGGTNLDAGLSAANTLMADNTISAVTKANKNVIALTDGAPTKSQKNGNGKYGSENINTDTNNTAEALKGNITGLYTICFAASNEVCYQGGPSVSEFLRTIASSAETAKTVEDGTALTLTFTNISSTITTGLTGNGWTVTDPMADNISVDGTLDGYDATSKTYTWKLANATPTPNGNTTTYTYTTSYTVKIDPNGKEADGNPLSENKFYPTNGVTTLNYKDANNKSATAYFPVPGVKVKLSDPTPPANVTANIYIDKRIDVSTGSRQPDPTTFTFKAYYVDKDGKEMPIPKGEFSIKYNGTGSSITGNWTLNIPKNIFDANNNNENIKVFIKEVNSNVPGWTYSNAVYTLHIGLDGKVTVPTVNDEWIPHNQDNRLMFANTYTYTPPARPSDPIRRQPTTTTTKPVQSVKTGDMGIALYAVTSLLSLSGTALLIKKRKDEK